MLGRDKPSFFFLDLFLALFWMNQLGRSTEDKEVCGQWTNDTIDAIPSVPRSETGIETRGNVRDNGDSENLF